MDNPETLAILCTKDTGRRQTKQINVIEKPEGANQEESRDNTKDTETLAILCTKDTGRRQTKQLNVIEKTKGAIKNGQSRDTGNIVYKGHRTKTNKTNKR